MAENNTNNVALRNDNLIDTDEKALKTSLTDAQTYIHAATSDNTRKAYRQDIRHFMGWGGLLPATTDMIIRYLHHYADKLNPRTLNRRLTALKNWHSYQGFPDPTQHPLVRKTLTGIKNIHGKPREKAPALQLDDLIKIVSHLKSQPSLMNYRNNALIQLGYFGAFRRSELANIHYKHITFKKEGIEILIPRSKTDQGGEGQVCAIPYGDERLCPVTALMDWCEHAAIDSGPIFRRFSKHQTLNETAIVPSQINFIMKTLAEKCKLQNAEHYSSHSLRRGFATTASQRGASFTAIMNQGRWRHEGTVLGYIDEGKQFEDNAANSIFKSYEV